MMFPCYIIYRTMTLFVHMVAGVSRRPTSLLVGMERELYLGLGMASQAHHTASQVGERGEPSVSVSVTEGLEAAAAGHHCLVFVYWRSIGDGCGGTT